MNRQEEDFFVEQRNASLYSSVKGTGKEIDKRILLRYDADWEMSAYRELL